VATDVRGAVHAIPWTGGLWVALILAIVGMPPFGPFVSELLVLKAALDQGQYFVAILYLMLLGVVFVGMTSVALSMAFGKPPEPEREVALPEPIWAVGPPAALCVLVVAIGLFMPAGLKAALIDAASAWGAGK
jgi:hydrogenase-4 component F